MITNFVIIGEDYKDTIESIKQFENVSNVSVFKNPANLNKCLAKPCDFLVLCEGGDTFHPSFLDKTHNVLQENIIGAVYTNLNYNGRVIYQASFCRQRIVREIYIPKINLILKRPMIPDNFFETGQPLEVFLKFSDKHAMYHLAEPLVNKKKI